MNAFCAVHECNCFYDVVVVVDELRLRSLQFVRWAEARSLHRTKATKEMAKRSSKHCILQLMQQHALPHRKQSTVAAVMLFHHTFAICSIAIFFSCVVPCPGHNSEDKETQFGASDFRRFDIWNLIRWCRQPLHRTRIVNSSHISNFGQDCLSVERFFYEHFELNSTSTSSEFEYLFLLIVVSHVCVCARGWLRKRWLIHAMDWRAINSAHIKCSIRILCQEYVLWSQLAFNSTLDNYYYYRSE